MKIIIRLLTISLLLTLRWINAQKNDTIDTQAVAKLYPKGKHTPWH